MARGGEGQHRWATLPSYHPSQVSLLKVASSALGIGAHQAMRVAETLYLAGYLSYPRTESSAYPPGTDLGAPLRAQASSDAQWVALTPT